MELIDQYRKLLEEDAELKKKRLDLRVELELVKLRMKLSITEPQKTETNDHEFLSKPLRTTREVAEFLGCSTTQVIRYGQRGEISGEQIGNCWTWDSQSCVNFLNARS